MVATSDITTRHCLFLSETEEGKYKQLDEGQSPGILLITCSDSRVCPSLFTKTEPGDLFVIRNAGNMVPGQDSPSKADLGTIQFAVDVLGVKEIVICGHTDCGAVKGLLSPDSVAALPHLANWLSCCPSTDGLDSEKPLLENVRRHAMNQVASIESLPYVKSKIEDGSLKVHAWVLNLGDQKLERFTGKGWESL